VPIFYFIYPQRKKENQNACTELSPIKRHWYKWTNGRRHNLAHRVPPWTRCYLSSTPGSASACWTFLNPTSKYCTGGHFTHVARSIVSRAAHSFSEA